MKNYHRTAWLCVRKLAKTKIHHWFDGSIFRLLFLPLSHSDSRPICGKLHVRLILFMIAVYHHHHYCHHDDHQLHFVSYCKSKPKMSIIAKCSFGSCKVKLKNDSGFWSDSIVPLTSSITLFFPTNPLTHTHTHTFYSGLIVSILSTKIEINYWFIWSFLQHNFNGKPFSHRNYSPIQLNRF